MKVQDKSKRKPTGGRYKFVRTKRMYRMGGEPVLTKLAERDKKTMRTVGDNQKEKLLAADSVNLYDPKTKKTSVEKIKAVVENPANRHYVRRNIITKGTIVETAKGKARITNRPGQEGQLNAVLI
ncbi:MAG: 30S ribosomal protein S8e [archaeon]